ncbi:uncharacterized protein PSFLO_03987 [Pseudozyma flocculosa]|uniref:Uncharacterized protein n=1 Tax=Pseudozyma flocculosa TaxID=84751 RepID=A0A5C3F520_9BASI|nr:uncharacterized protein PSFLO_03987 [Pseudozyma flocculosa]
MARPHLTSPASPGGPAWLAPDRMARPSLAPPHYSLPAPPGRRHGRRRLGFPPPSLPPPPPPLPPPTHLVAVVVAVVVVSPLPTSPLTPLPSALLLHIARGARSLSHLTKRPLLSLRHHKFIDVLLPAHTGRVDRARPDSPGSHRGPVSASTSLAYLAPETRSQASSLRQPCPVYTLTSPYRTGRASSELPGVPIISDLRHLSTTTASTWPSGCLGHPARFVRFALGSFLRDSGCLVCPASRPLRQHNWQGRFVDPLPPLALSNPLA